MAVRIRMKKLGRRHRPFFRTCATDSRAPRDGRVLEELGTYDPMLADTDARVTMNNERVDYWLSVGAQPSENVQTFIKKYGTDGTHIEQQQAARELLAQPKTVPDPGEPTFVMKPAEEPAAEKKAPEAAAAETPAAEASDAPAKEAAPEPAEAVASDDSAKAEGAAEESATETPAEKSGDGEAKKED